MCTDSLYGLPENRISYIVSYIRLSEKLGIRIACAPFTLLYKRIGFFKLNISVGYLDRKSVV